MSLSNEQPGGRGLRSEMPATAVWVIAISLAVIATCLVVRSDGPGVRSALAQQASQAGARGIFAFSAQLTATGYGVFMVDVDAGTVWCYEYQPGTRQLRLVAGRSWLFDKFLEDYNCAAPSPQEIEERVEEQRARAMRTSGGSAP